MAGQRVAIVGGGASGLTAVKQLLNEGLVPVCFELKDDLGGVFYDHRNKGTESIVYDSTVLTISNQTMAYSDFPPLGEGRHHWHWTEYNLYLHKYMDYYSLRQYMNYNKIVVETVSTDDGRWKVTTKDTKSGIVNVELFDALLVCSGTHRVPKSPLFEGQDAFLKAGGVITHSSTYQNGDMFKGKRVVCIGSGESAADIVREIGLNADKACWSVRTLPQVLPRNFLSGGYLTTDGMGMLARFPGAFIHNKGRFGGLIVAFYGITVAWMALILGFLGDLLGFNLSAANESWKEAFPEHPGKLGSNFLDVGIEDSYASRKLIREWREETSRSDLKENKFFTKNASFVPLVVDGTIKVNKAGFSHLEAGKICYKDGNFDEVDMIMCCTGYQDTFEYLEKELEQPRINVRTLYKHCIHPNYKNLGFCGWARPASGGIPIASELQARLFAGVLAGRIKLPERSKLLKLIEEDKAYEDARFDKSPGVNTVVSFFDYCPAMAKLIGCWPSMWTLLADPVLFYYVLFGGSCASLFRLTGPHSMPKVASAHIKSIPLPLGVGANVFLGTFFMMEALGFEGNEKQGIKAMIHIGVDLFKNKSLTMLLKGLGEMPF